MFNAIGAAVIAALIALGVYWALQNVGIIPRKTDKEDQS